MLECAIHPITYRGEGILATVVKFTSRYSLITSPSTAIPEILHTHCSKKISF